MERLLVVGDSFAASNHADSWTQQLNCNANVVGLAGASEYRILQCLETQQLDYDKIVVVHTSPNRIYVEQNPYYENSDTHVNCDLLYNDVKSRLPDEFAKNVCWWFKNIFSIEHASYIHKLMIERSQQLVPDALHLTFFDIHYDGVENWHNTWKANTGNINHMNVKGNKLVAARVNKLL